MKILLVSLCLLVILFIGGRALAKSRVVEAGPQDLSEVTLLGQAIAEANGRPIHVVYVHGMRAESRDSSGDFRKALIGVGFHSTAARETKYRPAGNTWPSQAKYLDEQIWTQESWGRSQPFRDRYVLMRGRDKVVIDEINWWPLLFPLKCRFLLVPETKLSGRDQEHLKLCARSDPPYYPWLSQSELRAALATRPASRRGAWPNGTVKRQIMNWGLADAVIALGPMREPITDAIEWAFSIVEADPELKNSHRVIISESLGSFVVLDALNRNNSPITRFVETTADLYFFANQFALLELARIEGMTVTDKSVALSPATATPASPLENLARLTLGDRSGILGRPPRPRQIVALSDPSDMLTWPVPCLKGIKVVNLLSPISGGPLGLFAHPVRAHRGHLTDKAVWQVLLEGKAAQRPRSAGWNCPPFPRQPN